MRQICCAYHGHRVWTAFGHFQSECVPWPGMGIRMAKRTRLYGLNLSRCLGDKFLKDEDLGLCAQPHVSDVLRADPAAPSLAILASDGLWDVTDPAAAFNVRSQAPLLLTSSKPLGSSSGAWQQISHLSA